MGDEPRRFEWHGAYMREDATGRYVLHSAYQALERELAQAREDLENARKQHCPENVVCAKHGKTLEQLAALKAEVEQWRRDSVNHPYVKQLQAEVEQLKTDHAAEAETGMYWFKKSQRQAATIARLREALEKIVQRIDEANEDEEVLGPTGGTECDYLAEAAQEVGNLARAALQAKAQEGDGK